MNMRNGYNYRQDENSRALDKPREYPLAPSAYYPEQEEDTNIRDYLQIILRRKWIVITFLIAVVTTVTVATYLTRPLYRSTATIKIDHENPTMEIYDTQKRSFYDYEYYETQYKVLKSKNLAKRVIRRMKLDSNPEFGRKKLLVQSASLLKQKNLLQEDTIPSSLVNSFISRINVTPEKGTMLVHISFISYAPELASKITNTLAKSFIELNAESKFEATQQARTWLENQIEIMKAKLELSEENLNEYAAGNEIIFLDYEVDKEGRRGSHKNIITKRLSDMSTELTSATSDRITKEALYNELRSGNPGSSSIVMGKYVIQLLKKDYAALESEYNLNLKTYKPEYPKMVRMREHINQIKKRISSETKKVVSSVEKDYEAALKREKYLESAFEKQKQKALDLNNHSVQYLILKRETDTNKQLYNALLQRMKETGITASIKASNIQVLDRAEVPRSPFKPNKSRNILLSLLVGLFGGIGLAFFADYLDNTVKTPVDIEKKLYLPSLGLVPLHNFNQKESPVEFISHASSSNPLSEAYTSIRTFLLFSTAGKPPKVMMVTSPRRNEGKTTTAINMSISLAKSSSKVLLIDTDMRKPRIHKIFKLSNKIGLSSFLTGNTEFGDGLARHTNVPNLDILTSGPFTPNPAELLSSYRLRDLIDGFYPLYDFIIFDTPPIIGLADSVITSTQTDGVILVVRSGQTPKETVIHAKKILESVNSKLLGVILNAINESDLKYSYYSGYQYYYQYYGSNANR
jgi:capsular exopolysaccharide synthesis family protein